MFVHLPAVFVCVVAFVAALEGAQRRPAAPRETPPVVPGAADHERDDLTAPVLPARRLSMPAPEAPPRFAAGR